MAQKRMFSIKIIDSAKFLKMPLSSQLLYFHLAMRADDDGVVEGHNVMRLTGINEDDLRVLSTKGFVKVLNDDLVAYIADWREHNTIRADRKTNSLYQELLLQVIPEVKLLTKKDRADSKNTKMLSGQSIDGQLLSITQIDDSIEQYSTEQVSIEQISIEQQQIRELLNCSNDEARVIYKIAKECCLDKNVVVVVKEKFDIVKQGNFNNKIGAIVSAIKNDWKVDRKNKNTNFNNFEARSIYSDPNKMKSIEEKLLGWDENEEES